MGYVFLNKVTSVASKICLLPYKLVKRPLSQVFGKYVGDSINVGQKNPVENYAELKAKYDWILQNFNTLCPDLKHNNFCLKTDKKTSINTLEITHNNLDQSKKIDKFIVVFMGNNEMMEGRIGFLCSMAKELDSNVICFNYRGKGGSTGSAKNIEQIIKDGKKQVQRLLDTGVDPHNIILYGQCFGAAVATKIAEDFHKENKKVFIFNDRSFSTLSNMFRGSLKVRDPYKKRNVFNYLGDGLTSLGVKCILNLTSWELDASKSYKAIPEEYKDYIVIKASKEDKAKRPMFDDGLIDNHASLHIALKKERIAQKQNLRKTLAGLNSRRNELLKGLNRDAVSEELNSCETKIERLNSELKSFKERIMKGEPNDLKEGYSDLQKKQKLKKLIQRIDIALPSVLRILAELKSMESYEIPKSDERISEQISNRKLEIEKELISISNNFIRKTPKQGVEYKITNLYEFADKAADRLIDMLWDAEKKITGDPNLPKEKVTELEFEKEGLAKIGHNKYIWELESRVPGESGKTRLHKFIDRTEMKQEMLHSL